MSDYSLPPCSTLLVGMTGSGKTTFALQYLLNVKAACRFVFDDLGQVAARLHLRPAATAAELEAALSTRWVVFNPLRMFPGNTPDAFAFFCQWVFDVSRRGPGKKVFLADEIWRFCSPASIPAELAMVSQAGRAENIELVTATQKPQRLNASITDATTEMVCFRHHGDIALARIASLGADPEAVRALPLGSFISYDVLSGGEFRGKVF